MRSAHIRMMSSLKPWLTRVRVQVREQDAVPQKAVPGARYAVHYATQVELVRAAKDPAMQLDPNTVDAALRGSDICVGAFRDELGDKRELDRGDERAHERRVAYVWQSPGRMGGLLHAVRTRISVPRPRCETA